MFSLDPAKRVIVQKKSRNAIEAFAEEGSRSDGVGRCVYEASIQILLAGEHEELDLMPLLLTA